MSVLGKAVWRGCVGEKKLSLHRVWSSQAQELKKDLLTDQVSTVQKVSIRRECSKIRITPAIRKDTKDRDIDRKQSTQTERIQWVRGLMMVGWEGEERKEGDDSRVGKCLLLVVDRDKRWVE